MPSRVWLPTTTPCRPISAGEDFSGPALDDVIHPDRLVVDGGDHDLADLEEAAFILVAQIGGGVASGQAPTLRWRTRKRWSLRERRRVE